MPEMDITFSLTSCPPSNHVVRFLYKNHRGEVAVRRVIPLGIVWGSTEWHPEPQWLLRALDVDKHNASRMFAMRDMEAPTHV